jgi:hypothetical protein
MQHRHGSGNIPNQLIQKDENIFGSGAQPYAVHKANYTVNLSSGPKCFLRFAPSIAVEQMQR